MSGRYVPYTQATQLVWSAGLNYLSDTIKVALVTASYTLSLAHSSWADVSTYEVTGGSGGYTTGGMALASKTLTAIKVSAANPVWDPLDKQFRYAVFYKLGTGMSLTNPLLGIIDYGDTVTVNNVAFTIVIPSSGIAVLSQNVA